MRPTRLRGLVLAVLLLGALGYLLAEVAYFDLPPLPSLAPVSLLMLTVLEAGLAKVVRDKVRGRPGRPMHPISIARVAVLAKASSLGGAALAGFYGGIFVWTYARRDTYASTGDDARVAGLLVLAALALAGAALVLERACRTPPGPDLG